MITIDDGFVGVHAHGWPLLREFGVPATLYVTTHYIEHDAPVFDIAIQYMLWKTTREPADLSGLGLPAAYDRPVSLRVGGRPGRGRARHHRAGRGGGRGERALASRQVGAASG